MAAAPTEIRSEDLRAAFRRDAVSVVGDLIPEPRFGTALLDAERLRPLLPPTITPAAVLVPLVDRAAGLTVLLTERATDLKHHAGQVAFPGGRYQTLEASYVRPSVRTRAGL